MLCLKVRFHDAIVGMFSTVIKTKTQTSFCVYSSVEAESPQGV